MYRPPLELVMTLRSSPAPGTSLPKAIVVYACINICIYRHIYCSHILRVYIYIYIYTHTSLLAWSKLALHCTHIFFSFYTLKVETHPFCCQLSQFPGFPTAGCILHKAPEDGIPLPLMRDTATPLDRKPPSWT